jgi:hypothetical protein
VGDGEPELGGSGVFLDAGEGAGDKHQYREVGREGVVLLIGRDGEEEQDEGRIEK